MICVVKRYLLRARCDAISALGRLFADEAHLPLSERRLTKAARRRTDLIRDLLQLQRDRCLRRLDHSDAPESDRRPCRSCPVVQAYPAAACDGAPSEPGELPRCG